MIFHAPEPPIEIPNVALTPFLLQRATGRGDKPAFIDGPSGRTLTHADWAARVRAAAAGLAARGFRKGHVCAIYSPNLPEYAIAFHAVSLLGGVNTTVNPLYTTGELGHQLRDAGARALITVASCQSKAAEAARASGVRELFVFGEPAETAGADGAIPFASLFGPDTSGRTPCAAAGSGASVDSPAAAIDPREDVVALPYSSGTTGLPKGVMLTHRNLVANILQSEVALRLTDDAIIFGALPFFHIYGMTVIMNLGLHLGATVITMPRFDFEGCLALLERYRVTFAPLVPPIVLALAKHPAVDRFDLSHLRTVFSGAAPLSEDVARAAGARIGCRVLQGYGLTETAPVTHAARAGGSNAQTAGIGPPAPNTEAKVVDIADGSMLGPNQQGEICVRGPQVMKGYLGKADATAGMIDADGWLHTGDLGFATEDGAFFVVDRLKELIKYKGLQIAPAELEAVLLGHPAVADAAVIPLADDEAGEVPKAFIVLKGDATPAQIIEYVAARVAPYKKLRYVEVIDQIPKSPSGKILRRVLKASATEPQSSQSPER